MKTFRGDGVICCYWFLNNLLYAWILTVFLFGFDTPHPTWPRTALGLQELSRFTLRGMYDIYIATLGILNTGLYRFHGNCLFVKVSISTITFSDLFYVA